MLFRRNNRSKIRIQRRFGLFYKKCPQMSLYASDENNAWEKLKQAGIYNKSKIFTLVDIDTNKLNHFDKNINKKMINKIIEVKSK